MSIEEEILAGMAGAAEVEHALDRFAEQIRDEIRDLTPEFGDKPPKRGEPGIGEPGDAKSAVQVSGIKRPGHRRVESHDPKAIWIEMGSRHMPEYAPFAKVAALHGGSGPDLEEGVEHAHSKLREELEKLEKLTAVGAAAEAIAAQRSVVSTARLQRSAAFRAARGSRGRGRRR